jgi:hypothetical protein
VTLSGGALAAALSGGAASAQVAAPLVAATAKAAVFAAAGHLAAVSTPVAVLTKGVLRGMFLTKLKVVLGVVLVVVALGAGGVAYRTADAQTVQPPRRAEGKPRSELEALRRENELLRLNLEVVLEKVRAQEAELRALRGRPAEEAGVANKLKPGRNTDLSNIKPGDGIRLYENRLPGDKVRPDEQLHLLYSKPKVENRLPGDVADRIEVALKRLLDAKDSAAQKRALDELREALHTLRAQPRHSPYYPQQNSVPRTK